MGFSRFLIIHMYVIVFESFSVISNLKKITGKAFPIIFFGLEITEKDSNFLYFLHVYDWEPVEAQRLIILWLMCHYGLQQVFSMYVIVLESFSVISNLKKITGKASNFLYFSLCMIEKC